MDLDPYSKYSFLFFSTCTYSFLDVFSSWFQIFRIGSGFLAHSDSDLRKKVRSGSASGKKYRIRNTAYTTVVQKLC